MLPVSSYGRFDMFIIMENNKELKGNNSKETPGGAVRDNFMNRLSSARLPFMNLFRKPTNFVAISPLFRIAITVCQLVRSNWY